MEDLKALFLALIIAESEVDPTKFFLLGNNEDIDKTIVDGYAEQVKANKAYMKLSFKSKLRLVEGAKEELVRFLGIIAVNVEGVNENEYSVHLE